MRLLHTMIRVKDLDATLDFYQDFIGLKEVRRRPIGELKRSELPAHIPSVADLVDACGTEYELSLDLKDPADRPIFEELLARTQEIEILRQPTYSVQGIYTPILVSPKDLPVRLA